ncbi:hypothetical protein GCM10009092_44020 [Bowmanella denitrificans]|uniref:Peptidase C39-like domain-containing protein n=1 Tax=Bowmanella denitrificans TaxID=366582 RepID=A0ABN0XWX3_9ALTE
MRKLLLGVLTCLLSANSLAISELILDPSPQSTSNTCQSYSIAYALAYSGLWYQAIETPKQLRELEVIVRKEINSVVQEHNSKNSKGKKINPYLHATWVEAVKRVSSNNLKLTLYYPSSPTEYYQKISDITGITSSDIFGAPIAAVLVKKPIMTSVQKLNGDSYASGHIVTLLGLTEAVPTNKSIANMDKAFLVLNSAVKSNQKQFNMCSEEITSGDKKYSASVNITNDYELKDWGGKYLLMWIEKNN